MDASKNCCLERIKDESTDSRETSTSIESQNPTCKMCCRFLGSAISGKICLVIIPDDKFDLDAFLRNKFRSENESAPSDSCQENVIPEKTGTVTSTDTATKKVAVEPDNSGGDDSSGPKSDYLGTGEAAKILGCSSKTIRKAIENRRLAVVDGPVPYKIPRSALDEYKSGNTAHIRFKKIKTGRLEGPKAELGIQRKRAAVSPGNNSSNEFSDGQTGSVDKDIDSWD